MKFGLKHIFLAGISAVFFVLPITAFAADSAAPTVADIFVGDVQASFDAYNINGNNYFKLRDIAYALNGSVKQFDVTWDAASGTVSLKPGAAYTVVGGEMSAGGGAAMELAPTDLRVQTDSAPATLRAYNIYGYNYFKLRDMGRLLNFGVTWDAAAKSITIAPNAGYIEESSASYMKSFGTYSTIAGWSESAALSQNDRYYYLKNGGTQTGDVSNICVESGRHRYAEADAQTFRETTYRRLLKQVANDSDAGFLSGNGGFTAKGYTLYTFTIEYENIDKTERMHYIIGDNKYILITETDYHDESAADIKLAAKTISDSFEWAR